MKRWLLVVCLLLFASSAIAQPPIGISPNIKEGGTVKDLVAEILAGKAMGLKLAYLSHRWSELEPEPGKIDLRPLIDGVKGFTNLGFQIALTIQTLDTNNRTLPRDLKEKPFDSPEIRRRFDSLLTAIAAQLTPNVRWVMLGNEVDVYLAQHLSEIEPYAGFVEEGRKTLRALKPGLLVGVTNTHDGVRDRPNLVRRLNRAMDVVTLTYYPLDRAFNVRPAIDLPADFQRMADAAGPKPLLMQEIGYPADPLLGSSEEKQAAFVDAAFAQIRLHRDKIAAANFFLLCDFNAGMLDTLLKYYRVPDARFRAYLATIGLKKADGTPRKAWARFQAGVREMAGGSKDRP